MVCHGPQSGPCVYVVPEENTAASVAGAFLSSHTPQPSLAPVSKPTGERACGRGGISAPGTVAGTLQRTVSRRNKQRRSPCVGSALSFNLPRRGGSGSRGKTGHRRLKVKIAPLGDQLESPPAEKWPHPTQHSFLPQPHHPKHPGARYRDSTAHPHLKRAQLIFSGQPLILQVG